MGGILRPLSRTAFVGERKFTRRTDGGGLAGGRERRTAARVLNANAIPQRRPQSGA